MNINMYPRQFSHDTRQLDSQKLKANHSALGRGILQNAEWFAFDYGGECLK